MEDKKYWPFKDVVEYLAGGDFKDKDSEHVKILNGYLKNAKNINLIVEMANNGIVGEKITYLHSLCGDELNKDIIKAVGKDIREGKELKIKDKKEASK